MQKVIVTGGSEGLGLELSKLFLEKNFEVICISRKAPDISNTKLIHLPTDLSSEEQINKTIEIIQKKYSEFSYLINCAGILNVDALWKIAYDKIENLFKVNTLAPIMLVSKLLEEIKKNEADIVNVGSTVWYKSLENQVWYWATKRAMRGVNENFQLELKKTKCRVIWFNPGGFKSNHFQKETWIKNDMSPYMEPKELAKFMIQILELPKNIEVSEIRINRKKA